MLIRYVLGRPAAPDKPQVLKNGKISTNKLRDTTADIYLEVCDELGQAPDEGYVEHLRKRDAESWVYVYEMFANDEMLNASVYDAQHYQKAIAKAPALPPKNAFECERCSWRSHCEGDPMALGVDQWTNVERSNAPSELRVKYGRTMRKLSRERQGFVVSPSELRSFARCQRLWALEYAWRYRQVKEGPKAAPRIVGSVVHNVLELLAKAWREGHAMTEHDALVELRLELMELLQNGAIDEAVFHELIEPWTLQAMANRAFEMFQLAMKDVVEIVEIEQRRILKMPGSKKWLHGIPDMVVRLKSGQLAIVEYKTTSRTKNLPSLADRYRTNPAVHLYAALVRFGQLTF